MPNDSPQQTAADDAAYIIDWATQMAKENPEILHIARQWVEVIQRARPARHSSSMEPGPISCFLAGGKGR